MLVKLTKMVLETLGWPTTVQVGRNCFPEAER